MRVIRLQELEIELRTSPRRRTLQLTVDRGGGVIVSAPVSCAAATVEKFVQSKQGWIYRKLAETEDLRQKLPSKQYVTGEGFYYLGRSYRLQLVERQDSLVKLESGRFKMLRSAAPEGRSHMQEWYTSRGLPWLEQRVEEFRNRVSMPTSIVVRDLGYRWGSCSRDGKVNFHWKSVLVPPRIIEYIVVHELVHLEEALHTESFWKKVERVLPDFQQRKQWLAENGGLIAAM